jgi:hypothetical protein
MVNSSSQGTDLVKTYRTVILVPIVFVLVLAIHAPRPAHAAVTGGPLNSISFPGATAATCGGWMVSGAPINVTAPGVATAAVTDGNGTILLNATIMLPTPITIPSFNGLYASQPGKNPIRVVIVIDGTTIGDASGDNPCLPPSGSGAKFFDPGDDRLNREPGQPSALYCRNRGDVYIYEVNPDDSKGKLTMIVTKAEIDAVINSKPAANTVVKQSAGGKMKVYYLPETNELAFFQPEARSGKMYSFVWKGLCR